MIRTPISEKVLSDTHVSLHAKLHSDGVIIQARFHQCPYTTNELSQTISTLTTYLPSIFKSKCYNDHNQTFFEEVQATEIGHLFEHILMEYMCIEHEQTCDEAINIKGLTTWNWYKEPAGTFTITLQTKQLNEQRFLRALNSTLTLMNQIITAEALINLPAAQITADRLEFLELQRGR